MRLVPAAFVEHGGRRRAGERIRSNAAGCRASRNREIAGAAVPSGVKISVFQADIDIVADRHVDAGDQLPGESALAAGKLVNARVARARAQISADAAVSAKI